MIIDPISICSNGFVSSDGIFNLFNVSTSGFYYTVEIDNVDRRNGRWVGGYNTNPINRAREETDKKSVKITVFNNGKKYTKSVIITKKVVNLSNIKIEQVDDVIKINVRRI